MSLGEDITKYFVNVREVPVCMTSSDSDDDCVKSVSRTVIYSVLIVFIILILFSMAFGDIQCSLANSGWVVYYLDGCGACSMQSSLLTGFPQYGLYGFDSSRQLTLLSGLQLPSGVSPITFPYWHNMKSGAELYGFQNKSRLRAMIR